MAPSLSAEELQQQLEELIYRNSELEEQVEEWKSSSQEKESILESITDEISEFKARLEDEKSELEKRNVYLEARIKELEALLAGDEGAKSSRCFEAGASGTTPRVSIANSDFSDKDAEILYLKDELRKMQVEQAELIKHDKSNVNVNDPKALVDELMRISLMAESASKLMNLIGRSAEFDVQGLSEARQMKTDEEKQKELSALLWDQVNEMHSSKKELEANLDQKREEIEGLSQEIKALEEGTVFNEKMVALRTELEHVNKQAKEFEQELEEADSKIEDLKVDIAKKDTIVEELHQEKVELVQEKNQLEEVKEHLETAQHELEQQLEVIQEDVIELNEKNSNLNDENSALVNEILDPGSHKLTEALAEKLNSKLHELGTDPGVTIEPGRKLPAGGFVNIPKELFDLRKRLDVIGAVPIEDLPMLAKLYKTVDPDTLTQLVDSLGTNPEFLQKIFNTIEENEKLALPVAPEDVENILQERGVDSEIIDVIMRLTEVLTPAQIGSLLQLQTNLPSEEFEKLLELSRKNPETLGKVLEGRPKDVQAKISDLIACEKSLEPEVFEQLLSISRSLDKAKLQALLSASAIDPEAMTSILVEHKLEPKDIETLSDVLRHLPDDQEKANVLSALKNLEPEEILSLLEICEQFPESASQMLSSCDLQPESIRAILSMKDTLDQDEMKQVLQLCKHMNEPELTQFLDLKTQNPALWHDIMADETLDVESVKNIAKLQQSLPPDDFERLLNLKSKIHPEDFQKLLKLAASNPMFIEELMAIGIEPKSVTELLDHYPTKGSPLLNDLLEAAQLIPSKTVDGLTKCISEDPGSMENIVDVVDHLGPEAVSKILETFQGKTLEEATKLMNALEGANQSKKRTHLAVVDPAESLKNLENAVTEKEFENLQNLLNGYPDEVNFILSSTSDVNALNEVMQKLSALESVLPEDQFKSLLDKASYMKPEQLLNLLVASEPDPNILTNLLNPANENQESIDSLVEFCGNSNLNCIPELLNLVNNMCPDDIDNLSEMCSKNPKSMENILSSACHSKTERIEEVLKVCQDLPPAERDHFLDLYSKLPESIIDDVMEMLRNHPELKDFVLRNKMTPEEICSITESQKVFSAEEFDEILKLQDQLTDEEFSKILNLLPYNHNTLSAILEEISSNPETISDLLEMFPSKDSPDLTAVQTALKGQPNSTVANLHKQILENPESFSLLAELQDIIGPEQVSNLLQSFADHANSCPKSRSSDTDKIKNNESECRMNRCAGFEHFEIRTLDEINHEEELTRVMLESMEPKLSENQQKDLVELLEANPDFLTSLVEKDADKNTLESLTEKLISLKQKIPNEQFDSLVGLAKLLTPEEFEEWLQFAEENPDKLQRILDQNNKSSDLVEKLLQQKQIPSKHLLKIAQSLEAEEFEKIAQLKEVAPENFNSFIKQYKNELPPLTILKALSNLSQDGAQTFVEKFVSLPDNEDCDIEKTANKMLSVQNELTPEQFQTLLEYGKHLPPAKFFEFIEFLEENPDKRNAILNPDKDVKQHIKQLMAYSIGDGSHSLLQPILNVASSVEPKQLAKLAGQQTFSSRGFNEVLNDYRNESLPSSFLESLSKMEKDEAADVVESYVSMSQKEKEVLQKILEDETFSSEPQNIIQCLNNCDLQALLEAKKQLSQEDFEEALKLQATMNKEDSDNFWALAAENPSLVLPVLRNNDGLNGQKRALLELFEKYPSHVSPEMEKIIKHIKHLPKSLVNMLCDYLENGGNCLSTVTKLNQSIGEQKLSEILDALYQNAVDCPDAVQILGKHVLAAPTLPHLQKTMSPESLQKVSDLLSEHPNTQQVLQSLNNENDMQAIAHKMLSLKEELTPKQFQTLLEHGKHLPPAKCFEFMEFLEQNPDKRNAILNPDKDLQRQVKQLMASSIGDGSHSMLKPILNLASSVEPKQLEKIIKNNEQLNEPLVSLTLKSLEGENKVLPTVAKVVELLGDQKASKLLASLYEHSLGCPEVSHLSPSQKSKALKISTCSALLHLGFMRNNETALTEIFGECEPIELLEETLTREENEAVSRLAQKHPDTLQAILQFGIDDNRLSEVAQNLAYLEGKLSEEEMDSLLQLGATISAPEFDELLTYLRKNPNKAEMVAEKMNGDPISFKKLLSLVSGAEAPEVEKVLGVLDSLEANQMKQMADLAVEDPQGVKQIIALNQDSNNLPQLLVQTAADLPPEQFANLAKLCKQMSPSEAVELLDMIDRHPGIKETLTTSGDVELKRAQLLVKSKEILPDSEFETLLKQQNKLDSNDIAKVASLLNKSAEEFQTLVQSNTGENLKSAIDELPEVIETSLASISKSLEKLDPEKVSQFAKLLRAKPSLTEFLIEQVSSANLDENERALETIRILEQVGGILNEEQLENLKSLKMNNENPEVLESLIKLMEKDPEKVKKLLDTKDLVNVASKELVNVAERLKPLELENLLCLAKTMDQNELKDFLDLNKEREDTCQVLLKQEKFDPDVAKEVVALSYILNPQQMEQLLGLQKKLSPQDFQQVLALQESRPEDFNTLLLQEQESQKQAEQVLNALNHLNELKDTSPGTILNISQLAETLDAETLQMLAHLSQNKTFPELIENFGNLKGSVEVLSNVSGSLGQKGLDNLGFLQNKNPEALKNLLQSEDLAKDGFLDKLVKLQEESQNDNSVDVEEEYVILDATGDKSLSCSVPLDGLESQPGLLGKLSSLEAILEPEVGNERRRFLTESLASLADQLSKEEFEVLVKLGREVSPKQFDSILKMVTEDPAKFGKLLKPKNGKTPLESLIQICNCADPINLDTYEEFLEKLSPGQLCQLAVLNTESPDATRELLQSKPNLELLGELLDTSSGLTPEQAANLLKISHDLDPKQLSELLQMIEAEPELKVKGLDSANCDLEKTKLLIEAKSILPEKDFKNFVIMQNELEPNEVKKLNELLKNNPTTAVDLLRNSNVAGLKEVLEQLPNDKQMSLDKISQVLQRLPQEKLDSFSKYLEKNPSVAEKILDLPNDELENVLSEILKEMEEDPNYPEILSIKRELGNSKDKLSKEQLRNLAQIKESQDPEDFQKFSTLLDSNLYSVGQLLQGKIDSEMPLKSFAQLASTLNNNEIENLVKLAQTLEPEQLQDFIFLDEKDGDGNQNCKQFLQSSKFNPEEVEKFLELQKYLAPEEEEMIMNLQSAPDLFAFLLDNPEKAEAFLQNVDGDVESVKKLGNLCRGKEPMPVHKLIDLVSKSAPGDLQELADVAEQTPENMKLFANKDMTDPLIVAQMKVSGSLSENAVAKLSDICNKMDPDEAKELLQILEAEPELKTELLSSSTFDVQRAKFLTNAKQILPESEFVKIADLQSKLSPQEVSKLNNLLQSEPTSLMDLIRNTDSSVPESATGLKEALKKIPDDKETCLTKISEIFGSLPEDKLQRFAKFLEQNPSFAEKVVDLPEDELQALLDEIMEEITADSKVMTPLVMKKSLGHVKSQLTDEQLENLEQMRKTQDSEVFQEFVELLKSNPESVGKLLEGKVVPEMPLEDFIKLAKNLNDEKLENLFSLSKTLDAEQMKEFLSLDPDQKSKPNCHTLLQKEKFNPDVIENILQLKESLSPAQFEQLLKLNSELPPEDFQQLLHLKDTNPEDFNILLTAEENEKDDKKLAAEAIEKINHLSKEKPETVLHLSQLLDNVDPERMEALAKLSAENGFTDLVENAGAVPESLPTLAKIPAVLDTDEITKLGQKIADNPELLQQFVNTDALDLKKALGSNSGMRKKLRKSAIPGDSDEDDINEWDELVAEDSIAGPSGNEKLLSAAKFAPETYSEELASKERELEKLEQEYQEMAMKLEEANHKLSLDDEEKEKLWGVVRELQEIKSALEQDVKALSEAEEKVRDQLEDANSRNSALEDEILELKQAIEGEKKIDEQKMQEVGEELIKLQSQNEALKDDLKELQMIREENQELRDRFKNLQEEMKHDNLKRQLDKLYWVNRELIAQIRERDIQTDKLKEDFKELQNEDKLKDQQIVELDAKKREQMFNKDLVAMTKRELEDTIKRQEREVEESNAEIEKLNKEISDLNKKLEWKNSELSQQKQINSNDVKAKENECNGLRKEIEALKDELKKKDAKLVEEKWKREASEVQQGKIQDEIKEKSKQLKSELNQIDNASSKLKMSLKAKEYEQDDLKRSLQEKAEEIESLKKKVQDLESAKLPGIIKPVTTAPLSSVSLHLPKSPYTSYKPQSSPTSLSKFKRNTFQEYMEADFSETYSLNSKDPDENPPISKNESSDNYKVPPGTIFPLTSWNDKPNYPTAYVNPNKLSRYGIDSNLSDSRLKVNVEKPSKSKSSGNGVTKTDTNKNSSPLSAVPSTRQNTAVKSSSNNQSYSPDSNYSVIQSDHSKLKNSSIDPTKSDHKSKAHAPNSKSFSNGLSSSNR